MSINDCSTTNRAADKGLLKAEPRLCRAVVSRHSKYISLDESNHRIVGTAYTRSILSDNVQHRLQIGRRTSDNTENLARCNLLTIARLKLFGDAL